ncbi:MAG: extracellular solute-binding protein [bacterium]|nr:extracellular solute-binding protein [bacterium]
MRFQYIILAVFGIMAVVAVAVFSVAPEKEDTAVAGAKGNAVIWGTFSKTRELDDVIKKFNEVYKESFSISYDYHDPQTFDGGIVEALASGRGPDILLLPDDLVLRHSDKIELISYQSVPPDVFQSSFVQAAEIYMRDEGLLALPFAIDPMVLYWNRDLFNNASLTQPPKYWDELLSMAPKLTKRNPKTFEIIESTIAFGEFVNVEHAKDVLAMLFLQVGNPLVAIKSGKLEAKLVETNGSQIVPSENAISAFRFYMDFSNPQKPNYTWNRARSNSLNEFINGNLALHLDYASAYKRIKEKNPHLNFAVAPMPLPRGTKAEVTFTRIHGLAVLKSSKNKQTAFVAIQRLLGDADPAKDFAAAYDLPPVIRKYLAVRPTDAALSVFYDAAIRGRTWLDPRPGESNEAFRDMVEAVSSGRTDVSTAIGNLNEELDSLLQSYQ